jgi:hypothetical protein
MLSGMIALAGVVFSLQSVEAQAQTTATPFATKYFLDTPPTDGDLANLPPQARDVIVAKIRLSKVVWLGRRDQSGRPAPLPKNIIFAQIELLDVLSGTAKSGDQLDVFIGTTPSVLRYITPPAMKARAYFVVIFLDEDNEHQLLGLPASQDEFERWEADLMEHVRMRDRPGSHD